MSPIAGIGAGHESRQVQHVAGQQQCITPGMTPGPAGRSGPAPREALAHGDQCGRVRPGNCPGLPQVHDGHQAHDTDDDDGPLERPSAWRRSRSRRLPLCRLITGYSATAVPDASEGGDEVEQCSQQHLAVGTGTEDVGGIA